MSAVLPLPGTLGEGVAKIVDPIAYAWWETHHERLPKPIRCDTPMDLMAARLMLSRSSRARKLVAALKGKSEGKR